MFTWTSTETTTIKIPRDRKKIAAVKIDSDQIAHIFNSCNAAARSVLRVHYFTDASEELIKECAAEIAKAASEYHKEVLGFYWKWI